MLAVCPAHSQATEKALQGKERVRRVLLLYPYDNTVPASFLAGDAVRRRLTERSPDTIVFHTDFLDLVNFPDGTYGERTAKFLAEKYGNTRFDAIIALNTEVVSFLINHRDRIAPHVPVVFCCVTRAFLDARKDRPADVTGIVSDYDITKTLELAERLQPDARNVVYISGIAEVDRRWLEMYRAQLEPHSARLNMRYLVGLSQDEILKEVSSLSRDTIVITGTIFADSAGRSYIPFEVSKAIAKASTVPTYSFVDPFLGHGMVGGYMGTFEEAGFEAADLTLEILAGKDARSIPPRPTAAQRFRVDAKELKRWKLAESDLPPDTMLYFKEPTIWQQHRDLVLAAAVVIVFQATLITALLAQIYRRRSAEQAAQAARYDLARVTRVTTMGELTASIAHEVNQPLAAIVASGGAALRWLSGANADIEQAKAALKRIVNEGHRAGDVITNIRAMFKKDPQDRVPVDVNRLIEDVIALLQGEIARNNVTMRTNLYEEMLPPVLADRVQLQQVILNLSLNAIEAMAGVANRARVLRIGARMYSATEISITVEDTGPGISPEHIERIFEAFYTTKEQGMGMGLSICRSIVEAHGGRLLVTQGDQQGSVFQVILPVAESEG